MFGYRVAGVVIAGTCVLASALGAGVAFAQYEPVGKPLQLVPQAYSSKPAATPRNRVSARKAARSETRSESGSERPASLSEPAAETRTRQHASFRRKHRPHTEVAEQRRPQRPAAAASAETTAPTVTPATAPRRAQAAPATAAAPAAAPAATAALPSQPNPAAAAPKSELVVGGQTVQVRSPNEANELDLAANEPSTTASAPANEPALSRGGEPLYNLAGPAD